MLIRIKIENFKGIRTGEISDLGKVNVFIGRNNSGKSCILDALSFARYAFNPTLWDEPLLHLLLRRRGVERSTYVLRNFWFGYNTKNNILFDVESRNGERLDIEIRWTNDSELRIYLRDPSGAMGTSVEGKYFYMAALHLGGGYSGGAGNRDVFSDRYPQFHHYLSEITLIDDYLARKLERLETSVFGRVLEPRLDKKVIEKLNESYEVEAEGLTYIPISPTTRGFKLPVTMPEQSLHIDELGDGTKYATTILSLCLLLENSAFLIEEAESHQHPEAIKKLLPSLVRIAQEKNVQLFITTHSLELIQILSKLPEECDVRFFHVQRSRVGELTARQFRTIETKLLSDLGVDLRNLEAYKKFIVVEGDEDRTFIDSLFQKYDKKMEEAVSLVKAGNKDFVKHVSAALTSTGKDIVAILDCNRNGKDDLMNSMANVLQGHNVKCTAEDNSFRIEDSGSLLTVLPMGLCGDATLENLGIKQHEMEDYCLKLIETDENLGKWVGMTLDELASEARQSKFEKLSKSKTLLQILSLKKGISYEDTIRHIIQNADTTYHREIGLSNLLDSLNLP